MRKQKGFSLIELLIVVAIILIIAAIAIPNLMRSRISANEASAVGSMRTLTTAEISYNTSHPDVGYTCTLSDLGPTNENLIDNVLANASKSGYSFTLTGCTGTPHNLFQANGFPQTVGKTGNRSFCSNESGVIRWAANNGAAMANCDTTQKALD